tara:strand:- start:34 stop:360 length:327 start_codon:yes stop_codon:yes gene_type:complete
MENTTEKTIDYKQAQEEISRLRAENANLKNQKDQYRELYIKEIGEQKITHSFYNEQAQFINEQAQEYITKLREENENLKAKLKIRDLNLKHLRSIIEKIESSLKVCFP